MPLFTVIAAACGAAAAAALGVLPLRRGRPPGVQLAWASSAAAGMMMAASFALVEVVPVAATLPLTAGAVVGVAFLHLTRIAMGAQELSLNRLDSDESGYGRLVLRIGVVHSAAEGVAIGAAMAQEVAFGLFVALALALHNIPEGTLLGAVLRERGLSLWRAARLAVGANLGEVVLALAAYLVATRWVGALPVLLGFAVGALVYLVMVDLLPDAYSKAGSKSIALAVILALWAFGLLHEVLRG